MPFKICSADLQWLIWRRFGEAPLPWSPNEEAMRRRLFDGPGPTKTSKTPVSIHVWSQIFTFECFWESIESLRVWRNLKLASKSISEAISCDTLLLLNAVVQVDLFHMLISDSFRNDFSNVAVPFTERLVYVTPVLQLCRSEVADLESVLAIFEGNYHQKTDAKNSRIAKKKLVKKLRQEKILLAVDPKNYEIVKYCPHYITYIDYGGDGDRAIQRTLDYIARTKRLKQAEVDYGLHISCDCCKDRVHFYLNGDGDFESIDTIFENFATRWFLRLYTTYTMPTVNRRLTDAYYGFIRRSMIGSGKWPWQQAKPWDKKRIEFPQGLRAEAIRYARYNSPEWPPAGYSIQAAMVYEDSLYIPINGPPVMVD